MVTIATHQQPIVALAVLTQTSVNQSVNVGSSSLLYVFLHNQGAEHEMMVYLKVVCCAGLCISECHLSLGVCQAHLCTCH